MGSPVRFGIGGSRGGSGLHPRGDLFHRRLAEWRDERGTGRDHSALTGDTDPIAGIDGGGRAGEPVAAASRKSAGVALCATGPWTELRRAGSQLAEEPKYGGEHRAQQGNQPPATAAHVKRSGESVELGVVHCRSYPWGTGRFASCIGGEHCTRKALDTFGGVAAARSVRQP